MSRTPVQVRDAVGGDAEALCRLWSELLPPGEGGDPQGIAARAVSRAEADPSSRILVAEVDGEVRGCAYLRTGPVSPLDEERVVHVSHLQAEAGAHRDAVERALVECAVSWSEHRAVETLVTATAARDRDTNRTLARLGLAQVAVLRGASVAVLRARLPHDAATARKPVGAGRSVGQVVAARRSQRRARSRQLLL